MTSIEELATTIAAQQRQIDLLTAQLDELRPPPPSKPPPEPRRVTITSQPPQMPFDFPTDTELDALNAVIAKRYPRIAYAPDDQVARRRFANAFLYMFFARRADRPNHKYAVSFWADSAKHWLRGQSLASDVSDNALLAAAVAHGVPYTAPPYASLGLLRAEYDRACEPAWRQTLASGKCPEPAASENQPTYSARW